MVRLVNLRPAVIIKYSYCHAKNILAMTAGLLVISCLVFDSIDRPSFQTRQQGSQLMGLSVIFYCPAHLPAIKYTQAIALLMETGYT